MTIIKNIENLKGGNKNLKELARLTLLNILSVQGVIYTHYKNKQINKGKYEKLECNNIIR